MQQQQLTIHLKEFQNFTKSKETIWEYGAQAPFKPYVSKKIILLNKKSEHYLLGQWDCYNDSNETNSEGESAVCQWQLLLVFFINKIETNMNICYQLNTIAYS